MAVDKEKIIFNLKALLCMTLIALWSFWFTNSSKEKIHKKIIKHSYHAIKEENKIPIEIKEMGGEINQQEKEIKTVVDHKSVKEKFDLQNKLVKELPKLEILTVTKTNTERSMIKEEPPISKPESNLLKEMINLNLPETASATRKALLNNNKRNQEILIAEYGSPLRKLIAVEKNKLKPVSINLKESKDLVQKINLSESWLPKYTEEKIKETEPKNITNNPDNIAEQIELAGIVNKPNSESTVIIRNKTNNYIEILKKGDSYKGLKLLEINKNEIVLSSKTKTYIKKINTGN